MGTATGLTASRMLDIEGRSVVNGAVENGSLRLTRHNGQTFIAGKVQGTRWCYTDHWIFASGNDLPVTYPDGGTPQVGDFVISFNGFAPGALGVVTEVLASDRVKAVELNRTLQGPQGPAGAPGAPIQVFTADAASTPAPFTNLGTWQAGTAATSAWVTFTAPASGIVYVVTHGYVRLASAGTTSPSLIDFEVRTGATWGGGTVFRAPVARTAFGTASNVQQRGNGGGYVTGLTPNAVYHIRTMLFQTTANTNFTNLGIEVATH